MIIIAPFLCFTHKPTPSKQMSQQRLFLDTDSTAMEDSLIFFYITHPPISASQGKPTELMPSKILVTEVWSSGKELITEIKQYKKDRNLKIAL